MEQRQEDDMLRWWLRRSCSWAVSTLLLMSAAAAQDPFTPGADGDGATPAATSGSRTCMDGRVIDELIA